MPPVPADRCGRRGAQMTLDHRLPTLPHALARLRDHPVEVGGYISLGAGKGDDTQPFLSVWPDASVLLVDMDPRFEPGYRELQGRFPRLRYDICGAAAEDQVGYQHKSDQYGGVILTEAPNSSENVLETPLKKLDTLVREHGLPPPYFIKFDTHGVELDILAGATEVLPQTSLIMMECYNFKLNFVQGRNLTFDEMSLHMKSLGFRVADMSDPLYRPGDSLLWQVHLYFLRADHPAFRHNGYNPPRTA